MTQPCAAEAPPGGSAEMFDGIAERYDLLNRLTSFGSDQSWRKHTVSALRLRPGHRVLDLATGTGDLALQVVAAEPAATVVGLDPSERMLGVARAKLRAAGLQDRVRLVTGRAEQLPFADHSFDAVSMAFGIRNVPDPQRALTEMSRVTRDGGRIAILELSEPQRGMLSALARFHACTVVPWLGSLLSGAREYRYLASSIAAFPPPEDFATLMGTAGLDVLEIRRLTLGAAHLYVAQPREGA